MVVLNLPIIIFNSKYQTFGVPKIHGLNSKFMVLFDNKLKKNLNLFWWVNIPFDPKSIDRENLVYNC